MDEELYLSFGNGNSVPILFILLSILISCSKTQIIKRSDEIEVLARDFIDQLANGDYSSATKSFDSTMSMALPISKLQGFWASLKSCNGIFKRQGNYRTQVRQYDSVFVSRPVAKSFEYLVAHTVNKHSR